MKGKKIVELDYVAVRSKIKNGDVFLYKGTKLSDRLLQGWRGSEYTHTGMAVWWNRRLMVLESAPGCGVIVRPLSFSVNHFPGDVEWFASRRPMNADLRNRLIQFAQLELGKEYSRWEAFKLGVRDLLWKFREPADLPLRPTRKTFCSFYVSQAYRAVGIDLVRQKSDRDTFPDDLARSRLLIRRGVLKHVPQIGVPTPK